MLTKNFSAIFTNAIETSDKKIKAINGTIETLSSAPSYICNLGCFKSPVLELGDKANQMTLDVGFGNTQPTINDFSLVEKCEQLTPVSITSTYKIADYENSTFCVNVSKTYKNNTAVK